MSDNWLMFIPNDPETLPSRAAADRAVELLRTFVPEAYGEVLAKFADRTEFHSGGTNWSGVNCPRCGTDIEVWWEDAMDKASASEFKDLSVITSCCEYLTTLNDLSYGWPAGFSRFVIEAMNPNINQTTPEQDQALSEVLGFELRKIWMHI
jgi:hypothetical protein